MAQGVWDVAASLPDNPLRDIGEFQPFVEGLDHPEGVAAGPNGEIYAGGEAGQIYTIEPDGTSATIANTGGFHLGLALDAASNVYVCNSAIRGVQRITPSGEATVYSSGAPERPIKTPNYPVFDDAGNLYVSDSGDWKGDNGCIFRVRPGGETEVWCDARTITNFPNGMALHPSGSHLYVVVSLIPGIVRVAIEADGSAGAIETVVELPHNIPDGLAFDEDDNLYISCYTPDVIYRLTPDGTLDVLVSDWQGTAIATPTNIAFCGPDRKTLVIASLSRWHLAKGEMPTRGARLRYPTL